MTALGARPVADAWPPAVDPLLARAERVLLIPAARPRVTVVVCAHDGAATTLACLESIAQHPPRLPYRVVVVDDASRDGTARVLAAVRHLQVVTNPVNLGFLHSANRGIEVAEGDYVLLLNNDTEVTGSWLDELVATADADPGIGVVGGRLVYPDGRVQEAGGIVWADGTGWNYGRGGHPADRRFGYLRDVDYVSGALLLVRRDLLVALGGLNPVYAPAYYEDTDLCFAAREHGYRVVYQPRVTVVHVEGASHGTDPTAGVKAGQERNRHVFAARWAEALREQHPSSAALVPRARDRGRGPRVLVVDHSVPTPDEDSGSVRMWRLIEELQAQGCVVSFRAEDERVREPHVNTLQQRGVEVLCEHLDLRGYLEELQPDLVLLSRPDVALSTLVDVRSYAPQAAVVYDTVDLHHVRYQREAQLTGAPRWVAAGKAMEHLELALAAAVDATLAVSTDERDLLLGRLAPGSVVTVLGNVHEASDRGPGPEGRSGLMFVGNYGHTPNVDAARVLALDVLPRVRALRPGTVLRLVGSRMPAEILELAGDGVEVVGWQADLAAVHDSSRVMVAPLRFGAGVKGKVGDAMTRGLPVVTTAIGAEGFDLVDGTHVLIAETVEATVAQVLRLLDDDDLWTAVADAAAEQIAVRTGPAVFAASVADLLARVGVSPNQLPQS